MLDAELGSDDESALTLYGYTRDLSDSGLAVVIPSITLDERACIEHHPLQITIQFPDSAAEIQAETVHCEPLDERELLDGYLIGAKVKLDTHTQQSLSTLLQPEGQ